MNIKHMPSLCFHKALLFPDREPQVDGQSLEDAAAVTSAPKSGSAIHVAPKSKAAIPKGRPQNTRRLEIEEALTKRMERNQVKATRAMMEEMHLSEIQV